MMLPPLLSIGNYSFVGWEGVFLDQNLAFNVALLVLKVGVMPKRGFSKFLPMIGVWPYDKLLGEMPRIFQ
jgi:hypothetical protein